MRGEISAPQEEEGPHAAQTAIDFGAVDAPVSQTVTISPASLQPLETFISVVDTIGDVWLPFSFAEQVDQRSAGPSLCSDSSGNIKQCGPGAFSVFQKLTLTSLPVDHDTK